MRIALRTSGGRGDYELAGSYNRLHASDILDRRFFFQITPTLTIDGKAKASRLGGKPRIRPIDGEHPYKVIASILLMPHPRRELRVTSEKLPQLRELAYAIAGIDVDVVSTAPDNVLFAPTSLWVKSRGGLIKVDFTERMAVITALWNAAKSKKLRISRMLLEHQASVMSSDHDLIIRSSEAIQNYYEIKDDVIPQLLHDFELPNAYDPSYTGISNLTDGYENEGNESSPEDSRRDRIIKWRKQADRGPGARKFSIDVREAYDYRCFFSGERYPKLHVFHSAGVDGAHILPWSTHRLNSVANGISLCKLCHWGFDNGLLRLNFDSSANEYILSIPKHIEKAAIAENFDLIPFQRSLGRINPALLPKHQRQWPSVRNIRELNSQLD